MKKTLFTIVIIGLVVARFGIHLYYTSANSNTNTADLETNVTQEDTAENTTEAAANDSIYLESIRLGGEWFLNNQDDSFLYYEYLPFDKEHPDSHQSMREMGSLWSITMLADFLDDERYTDLAEKGFAHFEETFAYDEENDFYYSNITPHKIKLGYSAFMILTLLEIDHPKKDEYLEKFAEGILYQQNDSGELRTFFYSDRDTGKDYYPGEALVSLMALYDHTKDAKYLNAVQKAFPFYRNYFRNNPNTAFVPWQTRAYAMLYEQTGDDEVTKFIYEMNDFMVKENLPQNGCSDFDFPRGITTSVFMEGVNKAYDTAILAGDNNKADCYANFVREAADLTVDLQITQQEMKDQNLEIEALGGYMGSKTSTSQRVDRNQHSVMALIEAIENGLLTTVTTM